MEEIVFEMNDIEDVSIIIKAKGKHFGMVKNSDTTAEQFTELKKGMLGVILPFACVISTPLEEIKSKI